MGEVKVHGAGGVVAGAAVPVFTTENWSTEQPVTVTVVNDAVERDGTDGGEGERIGHRRVSISHSARQRMTLRGHQHSGCEGGG